MVNNSPCTLLTCLYSIPHFKLGGVLEVNIKLLGAMGTYLIVATQRPEAKVVTYIIHSNLPERIALRKASEADSKIILGSSQ